MLVYKSGDSITIGGVILSIDELYKIYRASPSEFEGATLHKRLITNIKRAGDKTTYIIEFAPNPK